MNESVFQRKLKKYLEANLDNCSIDKIHGSAYQPGMADLIGVYDSHYLAIECKVVQLPKRDDTIINLKSYFTEKQLYFLKKKNDCRGFCYAAIHFEPIKWTLFMDLDWLLRYNSKETKKSIMDYIDTNETWAEHDIFGNLKAIKL